MYGISARRVGVSCSAETKIRRARVRVCKTLFLRPPSKRSICVLFWYFPITPCITLGMIKGLLRPKSWGWWKSSGPCLPLSRYACFRGLVLLGVIGWHLACLSQESRAGCLCTCWALAGIGRLGRKGGRGSGEGLRHCDAETQGEILGILGACWFFQ